MKYKNKFLLTSLLVGLTAGTLFSGCGNTASTNEKESTSIVTASENPTETIEEIAEPTPEATAPEAETKSDFEDADAAVINMGVGWNLGNTFDATGEWITKSTKGENRDFETAWGNPLTTRATIDHVAQLGFDTVRVPVTWLYHFDEEGNIDEKWMARVKEVVDWVLDDDMYCIVNIHHDTGADGWLRASSAGFEKNKVLVEKLWQQIAVTFADYPDKLLFEGFNEMLDEDNNWTNASSDAAAAINNYNQLFVDTVRATGGNNEKRNLICNTYAAANDTQTLNLFKMPTDTAQNHLLAEVHFYSPYEFCATTDNSLTEYTEDIEKTINNTLFRIINWRTYINAPVVIGEFGTEDKGNLEDRVKWHEKVVTVCKNMKMACIVWDNGGKFNMGLVDRHAKQDPFPEIINAMLK